VIAISAIRGLAYIKVSPVSLASIVAGGNDAGAHRFAASWRRAKRDRPAVRSPAVGRRNH
jgi:hypothetical protein